MFLDQHPYQSEAIFTHRDDTSFCAQILKGCAPSDAELVGLARNSTDLDFVVHKSFVNENSREIGATLMTVMGILVMAASAVAYFWASNYIGQNALKAGFSSLIGQPDPAYSLAHTVATFSPFTFGLGILLLLVGLLKKKPSQRVSD